MVTSHTVAFTDAGLELYQQRISRANSPAESMQRHLNCFADLCDDFLTQAATGEPYDVDNMPSKGKVSSLLVHYTDLVVAFFDFF